MRNLTALIALAALAALARTSLALDPALTVGVGGKSGPSYVTSSTGRSADDGLARPGFPKQTGAGMVGITKGGVSGGLNRSSDDGFHSAGMGKVITAGVGRSTMETVPGRSPTYINIVSGTRIPPLMGTRGP